MPQFWIAIFFILLAIAELYQSIKNIDLPLPVYLGLGMILAVASNYQQQLLFDSPLVVREASREQLSQRDRQITELPTSTADPVLSSVQAPLLAAAQHQDLD
jgi:hypothetical protein